MIPRNLGGDPSIYLFYSNKSAPTGEKLAQALDVPHGKTPPNDRVDLLIRWGTTQGVPYVPSVGTINTKSASEKAVNKLTTLNTLRDIDGVRVPWFTASGGMGFLSNRFRERFPLLARVSHGSRGEDIKLLMQANDLQLYDDFEFLTEYIKTQKEYRVHVFDGDIVKASEKRFSGDYDEYCSYVRNYENGWTFHHTDTDSRRLLSAVTAVKALGLDFGAVDVVEEERTGDMYILEVNTAPALSENSLETYLQQFRRIIE